MPPFINPNRTTSIYPYNHAGGAAKKLIELRMFIDATLIKLDQELVGALYPQSAILAARKADLLVIREMTILWSKLPLKGQPPLSSLTEREKIAGGRRISPSHMDKYSDNSTEES